MSKTLAWVQLKRPVYQLPIVHLACLELDIFKILGKPLQ